MKCTLIQNMVHFIDRLISMNRFKRKHYGIDDYENDDEERIKNRFQYHLLVFYYYSIFFKKSKYN
jgi:hypothetical protein